MVDQLSIEAPPGTVIGLVGANGSGKTTALRLIAGTLSPDRGEVQVCGAPAGRGASAFVPAGDRGLYWRISVEENLRFFARVVGGEGASARVDAACESLDLSDLRQLRVEACSTGQRRRVMVARAVVSAAPLLLVDEPFEGLDEHGTASVSELAASWSASGGVVIWAAPTADHGPASDHIVHLGAP